MIPLIIGPIIPGFGRDVRSWSILPRKYMEVSGKMGVPHGVIIPFWSDFPWNKPSIYPLVNVYQKNPRKITMHFSYHGKTHYIYIYIFFLWPWLKNVALSVRHNQRDTSELHPGGRSGGWTLRSPQAGSRPRSDPWNTRCPRREELTTGDLGGSKSMVYGRYNYS